MGENFPDGESAAGLLRGLEAVYQIPWMCALEAHGAGVEVVARVGHAIPEEPILATGRLAVSVFAELGAATPLADAFLDPGEDVFMRSAFEQVAGERGHFLSLVVLCPPYSSLSVIIEDLRRFGGAIEDAAPGHYFEFALIDTERNRQFARERTAAFIRRIDALGVKQATLEALASAIALTNKRRRAMQELIALRRQSAAISGVSAFRTLCASTLMRPEDYTDRVERLVAALKPDPALARRPRLLLVPSSVLTHDQCHKALEAAGGLVVAEDDARGSRAAPAIIRETGDPASAISDYYFDSAMELHVYPAERRFTWFRAEAVKSDIDGVIIYAEDSSYGWDLPDMKAFLASHGKASLFIRADARTSEGCAAVEAAAKPFIEALASAKQGAAA